MAICRPLTVPRRLSKMARAGWALLAIWLSSVLFSLPWLYYNKVSTYNYKAFRKVTKEEPNLKISFFSFMSACRNQSKFQITYYFLIDTQIMIRFYVLSWCKKKKVDATSLKFIYSEKATKFCKIFILLLTGTT